MWSLKLIDGDIAFDENGDLLIVEGVEETAQSVELALGTNLGEWFLNPQMGIKFRAFLEKNLNEEEMREQIRQGIFQEPRIKTVDDIRFVVDWKARTLEVSFVATTVEGERIERVVNIGGA